MLSTSIWSAVLKLKFSFHPVTKLGHTNNGGTKMHRYGMWPEKHQTISKRPSDKILKDSSSSKEDDTELISLQAEVH